MTKNGERIQFDPERIKVSVTTPVVVIKKLSEKEIFEILHTGKTENQLNSNQKRDSDIPTTSMVQAKRQKVHDTELPTTVQTNSKDVAALKSTCRPQLSPVAERMSTSCTHSNITAANSIGNIDSQSTSNTVSVLEFELNEVIWAKIKGFTEWPAKIVGIEKNKYEIFWFNDYRRSKVFRSQIKKFNNENFEKFSKNKRLGLEAAIKEAILYGKEFSH